jgi:hypothetical protein
MTPLPGESSELPNVAEILGRLLLSVPRAQQPLLIAWAERLAAARYRRWAGAVANQQRGAELLACADREEEIAGRVEGLFPDGAAMQRELVGQHPEIDEINRSLFADRSLQQQFAIQARGERLGAATWRSFAEHEKSSEARATLLDCARLEEESALVLESALK